ncbi:uncharacterized protein LOC120435363 isoform X2 [Oreochromis aureus]|uniref:uncharacterized protein LOC120435363 isoform X2 n=1 Tax=Oreochromis aureus TaxID=47969 RepID=UPI0019549417|nr:uncharacterized protein LOC120435363 isoform X2 [Oreochromis aureus]
MKVCHTLISFIFLTLQGVVDAVIPIRTGVEGGTITVGCSFTLSGSRKLFCKEKCEKGNILIETTDDSAQSGRYSIKYIEGFFLIYTVVYVSITKLEKSDSGRYRCSLDRTPSDRLSLNWDFEIVVTEAHLSSPPPPPTQSFTSGSTLPLSAFSESTKQPKTSLASSGILLPVVIIVVLVIFLLPVVLLLIYEKRAVHFNDLNRRRSSDHNQTEMVLYDDCSPTSKCEG